MVPLLVYIVGVRNRMYYSKRGKSNNNYVVIKHPLRQFGNMSIFGVKFCAGLGVVVKNSKAYFQVTKSLVMKGWKEFPLSFLKTAGFRTLDVRLIYGSDIYYHYLDSIKLLPKKDEPKITSPEVQQALSDEIKENVKDAQNEPALVEDTRKAIEDLSVEDTIEAHKCLNRCTYVLSNGQVCSNESSSGSPSGYCFGHIKYDEKRKRGRPPSNKGKEDNGISKT